MTHWITVDGDSHSALITSQGGRPGDQSWPAQMRELLVAEDRPVRIRDWALSGATTAGMLSRSYKSLMLDLPTVAVIYGGVNDPVNSIDQAATTLNLTAIVMAWKHGCLGAGFRDDSTGQIVGVEPDCNYVAGQADLPANGRAGQRYVVLADTSTTGGVQDSARAGEHAVIAGAVAADANGLKVTTWEYRNARAGEYGWARVATHATAPFDEGVGRIVVVSTPYRNTGTGGADTPATPLAINVPVRAAQQAVVTALNTTVAGADTVIYGDIYSMFRQRIVDGDDPNFSEGATPDLAVSWHNQENDQHLNGYGKRLTAAYLADLIVTEWGRDLA